MAAAPRETPASLARRNATFWALAFTFVWALALDLYVLKKLPVHFNAWVTLFRYQALGWVAAALLLRRRRSRRVSFAVINFAAGLAWTGVVYWAANDFAPHFSR